MLPRKARETEDRYRKSVIDALVEHGVVKTKADRIYYEEGLELMLDYDGRSPFAVACEAARRGDTKMMEIALADESRLAQLARRTRS